MLDLSEKFGIEMKKSTPLVAIPTQRLLLPLVESWASVVSTLYEKRYIGVIQLCRLSLYGIRATRVTVTLFLTPLVKKVNLVLVSKMDSGGKLNGFGIELLTQSNYKIWKSCMESFLVGEDLWSFVDGDDKVAPAETPENAVVLKKWKIGNAKAESNLKRSISHALFDHIIASRQMAGCSMSGSDGEALFSNKRSHDKEKGGSSKGDDSSSKNGGNGKSNGKDAGNKNFKCYRCGKTGHIKKNCRVKLKGGYVAKKDESDEWDSCFLAGITSVDALSTINFDNDWIVDSGCGHHLTGDGSKFSSFREYQGNDAIITADNSIHPVEKEGVVKLKCGGAEPITLNSVFQVPGMKKNVFSVANAVDYGHYVLFGPKDVKFLRNISNLEADIVHTGKRVKDLFVLSSYVDSMSNNDGAALWHARLGHINMSKLRAMVSQNLVNGLPKLTSFGNGEVCEGCQYGKAHRLPFDKSYSRCKAPLELIHCDLMGPCLTPSYSGCRYMMLLVDDYTRDVVFDEVTSFYGVDGASIEETGCTSHARVEPQVELTVSTFPDATMSSKSSCSPSPTASSSSFVEEHCERESPNEGENDQHSSSRNAGEVQIGSSRNAGEVQIGTPPLRRSIRKTILPARYRDDLLHKLLSTISNQWTWWWEASNKKDERARAVLTISILLLSIFYYVWTFLKPRNQISAPLPPGPRGLPIVGYLPFLSTNLHQQFVELAHQYGPIYKLWLGKKLCVVLNSPVLAKEVVRDQDTVFADRDPPIAALALTYGGKDIVWSPYGRYWRTIRKVFVREMLSNTSLEDTYTHRRDEVKKTIRKLHSKIGTSVEISKITFQTELNVIISMLWGGTVDSHRADRVGTEFRTVVFKIIELLAKPNVSDFFPILARFDVQGVEREMKRLQQGVDQILNPILESRIKMSRGDGDQEDGLKSKGKKDFIQILLELKEQEDASVPITLQQIKAMLMDIVVGGTDTTVTTVEWVMAELLHKPKVMKKVQEELADIVGLDNIVEESHMPKLHYLDADLKETFRLHPALPLLVPKRPNKSSIVGGYTIPKDTRVLLNVWAIHRDPQAWDDPSEFKPERFLSDASKWDYNGNNFEFLPFGSGRRICAGIPLAEKMAIYLLASFLHSFNWEVPQGEEIDLSERFGIVMKKSTPLIAIPTPRLSSLKLYE
ncbi:hypothetical protein Vadar_028987 [Vaccinium darrowii]|uniref:Uncharacterized protein n=1 Tax=Vaccinium darrowii TaxID=229202 RepID=A0ACB7ZEQ2_9ERIC|nr:hypothetical protein Vadar_028987 [Vaccinium darrowii]